MSQRILHIVCLCLVVITLCGCGESIDSLELNKWKITLKKDDKKPYGTYLAYNSLKYFFPDAKIIDLSPSYRFSSIDYNMQNSINGRNLMILSGLDFHVSDKEWDKLQLFVRNGNELVIFCSILDQKIENELNFRLTSGKEREMFYPLASMKENNNILSITSTPWQKYGYTGKSLTGYFSGSNVAVEDTSYTDDTYDTYYTIADTIGYSAKNPNCIRVGMGRGHITLHAAPLALSNYFLLQDGNINYLTSLWQSLPLGIDHIYWDDYYMHSGQDNSSNILWQHPATRWALILSILTLSVYILFQMKRRQRIIPVIPPLRNDSVSFVETVGRLYYNKGNHNNLAEKMVQQFLGWVRTKYYLNTNLINEDFAKHLAMKSGQPLAVVSELTNMIHEIRLGSITADEAYLYQLYRTIQQFYKNHHK